MNTPLVILVSILAVVTIVMSIAMVTKNKEQGKPKTSKHQPQKKTKDKTHKGKK
ncbi:MAG: hypothetical protein PHH28_02820 [Desulfuromonadaceae bacterium]|nr:hypothetical protein [Desulfuromonadaceae bacterium]